MKERKWSYIEASIMCTVCVISSVEAKMKLWQSGRLALDLCEISVLLPWCLSLKWQLIPTFCNVMTPTTSLPTQTDSNVLLCKFYYIAGAHLVSVSRHRLTSGWLLFPLCTIYDHSYVLLFQYFGIPPAPSETSRCKSLQEPGQMLWQHRHILW